MSTATHTNSDLLRLFKNAYQGEDTKEITVNQLAELLKNLKGATFASFQMFSSESKAKSIKGQKVLNARSFYVVQLNVDYYTKGNRRLAEDEQIKEEDKRPAHYTKINNALGQYNKDSSFCLLAQMEGKNQVTKVHYNLEGQRVEKDNLIEYFTPSGYKSYIGETTSTAMQGKLQEKDNFIHIAPKLENIEYIKLQKQVYKIIKE